MTEDGRDDHRVYPSSSKLGGDRVAYIVQPSGGVQPGLAGQALECAGEGVWVQGETISTVAHHCERIATLIQWVTPFGAKGHTPLQLFAPVVPDPVEGEDGKLNLSAGALRLERRERDGVCAVSTSDRLNASADEGRIGPEIDIRPGDAEDLRPASPGVRGPEDGDLPDGSS